MLTEEQKKILSCDDKMIVIGALAGTGKSSTLVEWCKLRPNKKILYLVFGKSMAEEAKDMFSDCKNVEVKTTHSLAYRKYGFLYRSKLTFNYKVIDCLRDLNLDKAYDVANNVLNLFNKFLASDSENIVEFVTETLKESHMRNNYKIKSLANLCLELWNKSLDVHNNVKITHDFYLKLYQLSKPDLGLTYDVVLLDEGQDLSLIVRGLLKSSNPQTTIIVGDSNQSIFQFRHCANLLGMYPNATHLELTGSFRVGQQIADMCVEIIKLFKKKDIKMTGYNPNQKVYPQSQLKLSSCGGANGQWSVIARTNGFILAHALEGMLHGKTLYFEGGIKSYPLQFYKDLYWFRATDKTFNKQLQKYGDWKSLLNYVNETEDAELTTAIKVINSYSHKDGIESFPEAIDEIREHTTDNKEYADLCLCTAHKSKGLTFTEPIFLENDFIKITETLSKINGCIARGEDEELQSVISQINQDINLLYVALTRAKGEIYLNKDLSEFFKV